MACGTATQSKALAAAALVVTQLMVAAVVVLARN
jgi:hypothetical protein